MLVITFQNDGTGTKKLGNYDWKVAVNGKLIASGRLKGYNRRMGWQGLIGKFEKIAWESFCEEEKRNWERNQERIECEE